MIFFNVGLERCCKLFLVLCYHFRLQVLHLFYFNVRHVVNKELFQGRLALEAASLHVLFEDGLVVLLDSLLKLVRKLYQTAAI